ncbi:hypothetical protein N1851_028798 [Merluccius polli]|uniref:Uncharacterized protein n=1 Tax=Merluccius polli TaxID=89951 RepID=A0AA47NT65_MERPO|nr:hypothetical protein N1851_028798 [Merluccius polli]
MKDEGKDATWDMCRLALALEGAGTVLTTENIVAEQGAAVRLPKRGGQLCDIDQLAVPAHASVKTLSINWQSCRLFSLFPRKSLKRFARSHWSAALGRYKLIILISHRLEGKRKAEARRPNPPEESACSLAKTTAGTRGTMLENKRERLKTFLRKIDEKAIVRIKHFMKER